MSARNPVEQLKFHISLGNASDGNIAVTGLVAKEDKLLSVLNMTGLADFTVDAGTGVDDFSISADGYIYNNGSSPTNLSAVKLLIVWADMSAG